MPIQVNLGFVLRWEMLIGNPEHGIGGSVLPEFFVTLTELCLIRAGDVILCLNFLISKMSIKKEVI